MPVHLTDFASLQVFMDWHQNVPKWVGKLWCLTVRTLNFDLVGRTCFCDVCGGVVASDGIYWSQVAAFMAAKFTAAFCWGPSTGYIYQLCGWFFSPGLTISRKVFMSNVLLASEMQTGHPPPENVNETPENVSKNSSKTINCKFLNLAAA